MPNTRATRNSQLSGMKKCISEPGVSEKFNSTYPSNKPDQNITVPMDKKSAGIIPTTPTPFGNVDLGSVSKGGTK